MNKVLFLIGIFLMTLLGTGCNDATDTNKPQEIHWDRDMCSRCVMVISDRKNTVQIQDPQGKSHLFDDLGCMVLWLEEEKIPWKDKAKIWVNDSHTGEWIDARKAFYDAGNVTPMSFGFSAHKNKEDINSSKEVLTYDQVVSRILEAQKR